MHCSLQLVFCLQRLTCISLYWQEEAEGEIAKEAREERDRQRTLREQQPETKFDMVSQFSHFVW